MYASAVCDIIYCLYIDKSNNNSMYYNIVTGTIIIIIILYCYAGVPVGSQYSNCMSCIDLETSKMDEKKQVSSSP